MLGQDFVTWKEKNYQKGSAKDPRMTKVSFLFQGTNMESV